MNQMRIGTSHASIDIEYNNFIRCYQGKVIHLQCSPFKTLCLDSVISEPCYRDIFAKALWENDHK